MKHMSIWGNFSVLCLLFLLAGCATLPNVTQEQYDGRHIEYALARNGTATVIFENGLDGKMEWWEKVLPGIAGQATTFAYNRPGYGNSDRVATPRDGEHIVEELRALLHRKDLPPPYVLVGHSAGGLYMQWFARRYPDEVRALILVDSTHPRQLQGASSPEHWPTWVNIAVSLAISSVAKQELASLNTTGEAVLALPAFTGKPVFVLSAAQPLQDSSPLADDANAKRKDIVRLYPGAKQVWVDSGHGIPLERPDAVITAILEALAATSPH